MITSDPDAWEFQPENTIKLKPWEKDFGDTTLLDLIPMLQVGVLRSCVSWLLLQVLIMRLLLPFKSKLGPAVGLACLHQVCRPSINASVACS